VCLCVFVCVCVCLCVYVCFCVKKTVPGTAQYRLEWNCKEVGEFLLEIRVFGEHISGSPFKVSVQNPSVDFHSKPLMFNGERV